MTTALHTSPPPDELYSTTAEFYELVARRHTASIAPALEQIIGGTAHVPGDLVEIGAGTGCVTALLGKSAPDCAILAAEPSPVMRAMLLSRIAGDPTLQRRVTVVSEPADAVALPEQIRATILIGVAGHMDEAERTRLWQRLTERLVPGGVIVVDLMGTTTPGLPPVRLLRESVGAQTYEWWASATATGQERLLRFDTTWKVLSDNVVVREVHDTYPWWSLDADTVISESGLPGHVVDGAAELGGSRLVVLGG